MQPAQPDEEEIQVEPAKSGQSQSKEEVYRPWVYKPFRAMLNSLSTTKGQYMVREEVLVDISKTLGVPPLATTDHIKMLSKKQDMEDLQA